MCNEMQEKLDAYAREIGGNYKIEMSIDSLISSHRSLRQWNIADIATRNAELQRIRDRVTEDTRQAVMHGEYISFERLRSMTLSEIAEFISER